MVGAPARRNPIVFLAAGGLAAGLLGRVFIDAQVSNTILLVTLVAGGVPLVARTLAGVIRGRFAADIVAALAILAALILGQYFAGVVIVLMQSGGEALERFAMRRASASLDSLLARAPRIAHRRSPGGQMADIPVEEVRPGDRLIVRPGDLVPVDGRVIEGRSTVDTAAITGEPFPLPADAGTEVASGTLNLEGALTIEALRISEESQYQQIIRLVETARAQKPPIQRLADRWAVWFTPVTIAAAALAYGITVDPDAVLAVLVVATPCPLILAVPVAVIAAISRSARSGVIIKSGIAVEQLGQASAVVFDKTGTLTLGHPTVAAVRALDGGSAAEVLRLAAGVEQFSSHHLGHAIVDEARRRFPDLPHPADFREVAGSGVAATADGRAIAVGSAGFLEREGVPVPVAEPQHATAYVGIDGRLAGAIEFADRLRPQVPALLRRLASLGVRETVMLSGDRRSSAEAVGLQAGIRSVHADLLPADKVAAVNQLKQRHGTVVMVGDGVNDAPALAAATVGVALGAHGAAAAAEAADVVVLVDDVSRLGDAVVISRTMRRIALQSIGIGLGTSCVFMVVAAFGYITPALGALLQEALDVAVILNALRAGRSSPALSALAVTGCATNPAKDASRATGSRGPLPPCTPAAVSGTMDAGK